MFKKIRNLVRGKRAVAIETAQEAARHFLHSEFAPDFFDDMSVEDIEEFYLRIKFGVMYLDEDGELYYERAAYHEPLKVGDDFRLITGPWEDNHRMSLMGGSITGETESEWEVSVRFNVQEGRSVDQEVTSLPKRFPLMNFTRINQHRQAIERAQNAREMHAITAALVSGDTDLLDIQVSADGRSTNINLKK